MANPRFLMGAILAACSLALAWQNEAHAQFQNGVLVDADGVLRNRTFQDPGGRLMQQRINAAKQTLDRDVAKSSKLRKISLTKLEAAVAEHLETGKPITDEMRNLAGLTRLQYVFYYPETKEIVIAGPAEGWTQDLAGRPVGVQSQKPLLELQDLVAALRMFAPGSDPSPVISVSIDPTQEGLAKMQEFLRQVGSRATPDQTEYIVNGLRQSLGNQKIVVRGIPANTHFAQVLIEADYRMKLIGIGLEPPPAKITTFIQRASPGSGSRNGLQRWYFVPDYECVRTTTDGDAIELVGNGVKLIGEDQAVSADGSRAVTGNTDRASQAYTTSFTQNYARVAAAAPVYAQMRNCIDLAVAAAYIREHDLYGKADWDAGVFASEEKFPVQTYNIPQEVETAINSVWKGTTLLTPIGGGVNVQAAKALEPSNLLVDEKDQVKQTRQEVMANAPAERMHWWWD